MSDTTVIISPQKRQFFFLWEQIFSNFISLDKHGTDFNGTFLETWVVDSFDTGNSALALHKKVSKRSTKTLIYYLLFFIENKNI